MKLARPYNRFLHARKKINKLETESPRLKRVFFEFNFIDHQLKQSKMTKEEALPDDFWMALELQKNLLEREIKEWLAQEKKTKKS